MTRRAVPVVKLALVGMTVSVAMVLSGLFVPIVGLILAAFAPDVFLASVVFLVAGLAAKVMRPIVVALLLVPLVPAAGLNTRLPSFVHDWLDQDRVHREIGARLSVKAGAPIHVVADPPVLTSRLRASDAAGPRCTSSGPLCMATMGFESPNAYWSENVGEMAKLMGFSIAKPEEAAPRLSASQVREGRSSIVALELSDEQGKVVSRYRARYREGFPLETPDNQVSETPLSPMFVEYLLHANLVNRLAFAFMAMPPDPVKAFLHAAVNVVGEQRNVPRYSVGPRPEPTPEPAGTEGTIEILEESNYDPARNIDQATWDAKTFDAAAAKACQAHVKNEVPQVATWMLFVEDPTGRRKVRWGRPLCSGDSIWFAEFDRANHRLALNKYSYAGELSYRVRVSIPHDSSRYESTIMWPTFQARDGYLYFDLWSVQYSGRNHLLGHALKVRIKEPAADPAGAQ